MIFCVQSTRKRKRVTAGSAECNSFVTLGQWRKVILGGLMTSTLLNLLVLPTLALRYGEICAARAGLKNAEYLKAII